MQDRIRSVTALSSWEPRHKELNALLGGNANRISSVWGWENVLEQSVIACLKAPMCLDYMKLLPVRLKWSATRDFEFDVAVNWHFSHQWLGSEKEPQLQVAAVATCEGERRATYEVVLTQRAPRSRPSSDELVSNAQRETVSWAKNDERYNRFTDLFGVIDPVFRDVEFARALGLPHRVIHDVYLLASLWVARADLHSGSTGCDVVLGQPAIDQSDLHLSFENTESEVNGALVDFWNRTIWRSFRLTSNEGSAS